MDMSVKLNLSYPAVAPQSAASSVTANQDQPKVEAVASSGSEPKRDDLQKP